MIQARFKSISGRLIIAQRRAAVRSMLIRWCENDSLTVAFDLNRRLFIKLERVYDGGIKNDCETSPISDELRNHVCPSLSSTPYTTPGRNTPVRCAEQRDIFSGASFVDSTGSAQ